MKPPHQFVRPIWDDGPYDCPTKLFFIAEAADNFQLCENGRGVTFQLAGRHLVPQYRVDFANRFTAFAEPKPNEKPELEGKVEIVAPDKIRIQIASNHNQLDPQTEMVVGQAPPFEIKHTFATDAFLIESDLIQVEVRGFPFKILIREKSSRKLIFESQDSIQSYVDKGWNFPVGQMIDTSKKYPKITFFSTKINIIEHFYGTGEMFGPLDKLGKRIYLDICDTTTTDTERHYKAIPFYMSTNHYGVFINQSVPILLDFAASSYRGVTFQALQDFLDIFVIYGQTMKDILDSYTELTGKCEILPPKWSFGLWMSRISYKSQQEVYDTIKAMRDHEVPLDVLHIDTDWFERGWECDFKFSKTRFPNPEQMIADAHRNGVKISLWQLPYVRNSLQLYQEGERGDFFARPPKEPLHNLPDLSGVIDLSNPMAVNWYKSLLQPLIKMGIDVIKTDFGESAHPDLEYAKHTGVEMHNLYPLLYNKAIWELIRDINGKPIIWARSAYAGSQRYPVHWAGDPKADLRSMYSTLRGGLSFGMSGFTFWSHDMGGFTPRPSEETFQRWSQFGFWTSHSRCHGVPPREPYLYSKRLLENFKKYDSIKYRLLPYIYSQAYSSMQKGIPLLRAMVLEFETDPTTYPIDDQYMFGDSFLVAPVIEYGCTERKVYFPAGLWYAFESNSLIEGPYWQTVATPLDIIPVFVRAGSIIPMGPPRQFIEDKPEVTLDLHIYPLRNVKHEVMDQSLTFKYYDLKEIDLKISIKQGSIKLVSKIPDVHTQIILH